MKIMDGLHAFMWRDVTRNNCNTYFIEGSTRILIDPGLKGLFSHVKKGFEKLNVSPEDIDLVIATHGHPDHLEAVQLFGQPTMFAINRKEYRFFEKTVGKYFKLPDPAFFLQEGELAIGDNRFQVISTPGHSPGSISLYWIDRKVLFSGDVIFSRGVGRTDLPGGKGGLLKESIKRLATLDIEYLMPGHGVIVSGKEAVQANFQMIEETWFSYLR